MIVKNLKIFLQNICKNSLLVNTLLETLVHFDIILIQEPPWSEIRKIPSISNHKGDPLMGSSHHPTGFPLLELLQTIKTSLESSHMSTIVFLHFAFFYAKTSLIIETSASFLFPITTFAIIS